MPFRHVAFFIKCRARGCGICSWAAGGRNCSARFCLLHPPKLAHAALEVDKNRAKSLNFVYRDPQKPRGLVSYHIGKCCQNQPARSPSS